MLITDGIDVPSAMSFKGLSSRGGFQPRSGAATTPSSLHFIDDLTSAAPIYDSDDNTKPHHGAAIQLIIIILAALHQIVANAKSGILQPPFFTDPLYSIKLPAVQALYPEHFKFLDEDVAYRITGGAVGTALGRYNFLLELAAMYK